MLNSILSRIWNTEQWLDWWGKLSPHRKVVPAILLACYWLVLSWLGGLGGDLVFTTLAITVLYYLGPRFRPLFQFVLPLILIGVIYDSMRYYADFIRGPIHVREPYDFDKFFFGVTTAEGVLTPNEWFQKNTHAVLDFFTGLAYIIFIPVYFLSAAYFRFWLSRKGTQIAHPKCIYYRSPQIMWAFFWVNIIGYSTYYWYAASPPWYVELYGFGPARLDVPANLAGCVRFDELLGIGIFKGWYSKSADVHGAIPSLHISYPLMMVYYAFRFGALRIFSIFFYLLMCFSAVYLNHHYVLDLIWGSVYGIVVAFAIDMIWNWKLKKEGIIVPTVYADDDSLARAT